MEERPWVIAVDFDGTLCENKWPEIGEPNLEVIEYVKRKKSQGAKIILWTCRTYRQLEEAVKWCEEQGMVFDAVNENLIETIIKFGEDTRKIVADEYIDDRANTKFELPYSTACPYYHAETQTTYIYNVFDGDSYAKEEVVGECWGTKNREVCGCNGNKSKCDHH